MADQTNQKGSSPESGDDEFELEPFPYPELTEEWDGIIPWLEENHMWDEVRVDPEFSSVGEVFQDLFMRPDRKAELLRKVLSDNEVGDEVRFSVWEAFEADMCNLVRRWACGEFDLCNSSELELATIARKELRKMVQKRYIRESHAVVVMRDLEEIVSLRSGTQRIWITPGMRFEIEQWTAKGIAMAADLVINERRKQKNDS